jgi:hypothetical protein
MNKEVNISRSETWMDDNFNEIQHILHETIDGFVEKGERIINIEAKERNGLNRFWIYTEKLPLPNQKNNQERGKVGHTPHPRKILK